MTKSARSTGWIAGTVVLVLAIFAATWFLLAGPRFDAAAQTMLQAENAAAQNDLLTLQNAQLRSDFESLDQYKAEVAALQVQIPTEERIADYLRTLDQVATDQQVFLSDFSPAVPLAFAPVPPSAPAPAPTEELETEGDVAEAAEPDGTLDDLAEQPAPGPSGPVAPEGMVSIPFTMTVTGTYANGTNFLQAIQTGTDRLMLVTKVDGFRQQAAEATEFRPAIADGDVQFLVTGFLYVLPEDVVAPTPVEGEEPAPVPLPSSDRNPFAPLG